MFFGNADGIKNRINDPDIRPVGLFLVETGGGSRYPDQIPEGSNDNILLPAICDSPINKSYT